MNKVVLCGRLAADPEVRWTQGPEQICVGRYTLAVDRRKKEGEQTADFITCVAFRNIAEFAEKYLKKGTKIIISGHIQTGSYTDKEGRKIRTTDVVVEEQEFAESKQNQQPAQKQERKQEQTSDGFMQIPDIPDGWLPFN